MLRPSFVCGASVGTLFLCLAATTAFGQEAVIRGAQQKSVQVVRASTPPVIDGVLDEAVWQTAAVVDDLHEIEPVEYAEPSEYTVVRVLFDDESLYVAARMYDDEPEQITARIMRHGQQVWGDDFFALVIDPFYDRRNGYRFVTNPNGVRQEGLFQNVTDTEWEWQGIWYAAASIDDEGWTAEIRIPLNTISFDPDGDTWGINFRRGIGRRDERIGWVSRNRQTGPSTAGIAVGFEGLRQGRGLDIVPSIAVTERKTFATVPGESSVTTTDTEPSLDVFYKITPGLTSALTINTDFSATEVDDRQVNLTRFGLFFPEKRDFFLQDADIFEFGSLDNNGRPFFSRSIGLSASGEPVDLEVGGKITGRVGRFNIGALTVRQDQSAGRGVTGNPVLFPKDNAVVARVSANILEESAIGLIATEGNPTSDLDNSVQGIDFAFRNTRLPGNRSMAVTAWAQQSDTEGSPGDDRAYGFRIDSPNEEGLQGDLAFTHIEENFNPGLGFVNNEGIEQINYNTMHVWRRSGLLRMIRTGVDFEKSDYIDDGGLQSKRRTLRLFEIESFLGDQLEIRHHWRDEVLIEDFEISEGVVLPVGAYSFRDLSIEFETASNRKLSGQFGYREGPFYGGDRVQTEFGVSWRPSRRFFASMSYEINDIDLPQGNFVTRLAQYRTEVAISPRLSWVTLVQYDNVSEIVGVNSRVHWFPEPGREAFVVINHNVQDLDRDNTFHSIEADISIKYNYTFRF